MSKTVQPIRDRGKIEEMREHLKLKSYRDYFLFEMGINVGLRIGDLVKLKVSDVYRKKAIIFKDEKSEKNKRVPLSLHIREVIEEYVDRTKLDDNDWLFASRKRTGKNNGHITRVQAYRILNKAAKELDLDEIGTHSLRKTFGYHYYQNYKDVAMLQELFGHSAPSITLRYIGINDEMIEKSLENFSI
ncbi:MULTISPECIES: tyrosine-type recombinase/integrase [Bacillati]|uniref:Tyrosine-type recombinase/integrase n=1 Tax=Halobacillus naozhouensis TaxID=554880 RepID=A0ABY8J4U3_9BACI|nr:tyrosine-type recombinase/integrase [Halobacillus naozhouensis]WFT77092.1 tyrosine-type recombinase/integrase [Halobacillus naozhouensis]